MFPLNVAQPMKNEQTMIKRDDTSSCAGDVIS